MAVKYTVNLSESEIKPLQEITGKQSQHIPALSRRGKYPVAIGFLKRNEPRDNCHQLMPVQI